MKSDRERFPLMVPTSWWLKDIQDPVERLKRMKWLDGIAHRIQKGETTVPGIRVSKKGTSWIWIIWGPEEKNSSHKKLTRIEQYLKEP